MIIHWHTLMADQMNTIIQYWFTMICFIENVACYIVKGLSLLLFLLFDYNTPKFAGTVPPIVAVYLKPINQECKRVNIFIIATL